MAGVVVPGRGYALEINVGGATPVVTAMGPWSAGTFVDRIRVTLFLQLQSGNTALRLGFAIGPSGDETLESFNRASRVWFPRSVVGARLYYARLQLTSGAMVSFDVDVGAWIETGSQYVLAHHDLEDGLDEHHLYMSVRARRWSRSRLGDS